MTTIVGIDPGLSGAVVSLTSDGVIHDAWDMPTLKVGGKRQVDPAGLREMLIGHAHAVVERVHAMPGQGVASCFSFGMSLGVVVGALGALQIPFELVTPQRWKKAMMDGMGKEKDASRQVARQLWPEQADVFSRKKDHGKADAALMGEWMRRRLGL